MNVAANSAFSRDIAHVLHPYTHLKKHEQKGPLIIVRGEGIRVIDEDGKSYIEGLAGLWCMPLGFSERRLVEAARRQLETLPYYHAFAHKSHEPSIDLADRILAMLPVPMSKVFFNTSGSLRAMVDSLTLCPPLVTTKTEVGEIFDCLERSLERIHGALKARGLS